MSDKNINTITDCIRGRAAHAHFAKCFSEGTDADGTPLPDLYQFHANSLVLTARGKAPFVHDHGWVPEDKNTPRLSAIYHPWAVRFDVISFVIKEVISPTEIELALFDIFTLGPKGFDYMVESEGIPFDLVMDFSTNHYDGDYPVLTLYAQDHGQPIDMIMKWAWTMIRGEAKLDNSDGLVN